jgi:subtilisin family serine protease
MQEATRVNGNTQSRNCFHGPASRLVSAALSIVLGIVGLAPTAGNCQSLQQRRLPAEARRATHSPWQPYEDDVLLLAPKFDARSEQIARALKEANATVVGSIGEGDYRVLIVKTPSGMLQQTESHLYSSGYFRAIQPNYISTLQNYRSERVPIGSAAQRFQTERVQAVNALPSSAQEHIGIRDHGYYSAWHLGAMHVPKAWKRGATGAGVRIAVFDTGCSAYVADLQGKTERGFDAAQVISAMSAGFAAGGETAGIQARDAARANNRGAYQDENGHGTKMATVIAAKLNNQTDPAAGNVVGIAPDATIVPVRITDRFGAAGATEAAIIEGLDYVIKQGIKIVVIASNGPGEFNFSNYVAHTVLYHYLDNYMRGGGLVFFAAGNHSTRPYPGGLTVTSYLQRIVFLVAGINRNLQIASYSNYNGSDTMAAPSDEIVCADKDGNEVLACGTSFAAGMVAGVAALVWSAKPGLRNSQVQEILLKAPTYHYGDGYRMPDANIAVDFVKYY